ncbi:glycylpeptide N-tetradecanoyltransferase [Friedmanniomyces endolithicus]|uniref:Glycylpeptide N-tetradecanoyltransferase n=1 Tax=Friedmanniomyces endolithicus TaxID=329885 RepID=A0AAN6QZS8_9PEZI|nr:glycylpeptide N-tetradecanoyltransferase [Friedmanniomyces endolithicus]KAK0779101.1 glycylpeptide N-tetradecanoyltransferase [Friedmanniomyces endolithicus]KAK0843036.1 glycylpeptide N-tetradecanoyltransferase [Friedmanniomyces endolithicus]KAK0844742.1 glycylpeptide N-tetradecanoyltransferase [Friedmanniomyces endolithicus]KAK1007844.1 glycylpeptide N-tetradecanoyltransferase [Friedmanniomyces endolithicus]
MVEGSNSKAQVTSEPQLASDMAGKSLEEPGKTEEAAGSIRNGETEDVDADVEGAEEEDDDEGGADGGVEADGTAKPKKKRKPRKKKKKGVDGDAKPDLSTMQKPFDVKDLPALLKRLAMAPDAKSEGKAPEDYKFWNTQPVPKFKEPNLLQTTNGSGGEALPEGAILPDKVCKASVKPDPEPLLDGFEWCLVDLENPSELQELYDLLYSHYVEDTDGSFRFNYSAKFLAWALKPPGYKKDWHIGVRTKATAESGDKPGKLVAFIAGVPATIKVRDATLHISEINFLTVHRKLRAKRLAPVLIKEVTRRCYQVGVYQALYTAGTLLPTPVTTARYFHRSLDWEHLYKTGFSHLPSGTTELRQKYKYRLDSQTSIKGLRAMKTGDLPAVKELLAKYLERFALRQEFEERELEHWLCSKESEGVVWSFVVEDGGKITDFMSYYLLESTVLKSASPTNHQQTIRAAYLSYYASSAAFTTPKSQAQSALQARLQILMHNTLILAKRDAFHVFNALTTMDNPLFLKESKFEPGDGRLHYYLFNWRTGKMGGGVDDEWAVSTASGKMGGVGVVML